jgi:DNA (cytosine-5)-methyltransferase 1
LTAAVKMWPTPRSCSAMAANITPESAWADNRFPNLETVVGRAMWPTPNARDWKGAPSDAWNQWSLPREVGGALNPTWVEWLMGWPLAWTDCAALATDKFRQWRHSHGICSEQHPAA